ncbi:DUF3099 domain-containing protein [Agromyces sp. ISL-38]|uniref:DUF3099 domain-containing protein n=1 Tax=Agromyces sp. ISL-38 TaxID=2819107 RepID=UPI001BEC5746|nr:DUF3099 domain-containing protein [Agromyces sp. ISL-38]MBT2499993.1 DUF3099 domain-containing protein [Agromyces sp. ISL-38]MBT2515871.1 DUF3099 domain-containing protein [Streptomyces sp. ISL-90]
MKQQSITSLPPSPEAERRSRMIKYTIAMSIRVLCIFAMLFAQGWWLVVFAAGAIFLPYIAVVLANVGGPTRAPEVLRPGNILPTTPPNAVPGTADAPPTAETPTTTEAPTVDAPEANDEPDAERDGR